MFCHVQFCTLNVHINICFCMGFRHAHFCTNDYPFLCVWVFVMHISVRMTIHFFLNCFSLCTYLYEWLSISLCIGFRHAHLGTNDYPYSFRKSFRHVHLYTNDYPFLCLRVSVMHISVRMTIDIHMGFHHGHFCTNDYPYSFWNGFRRAHFCTNDYPYSFWNGFRRAHFCTNNYFVPKILSNAFLLRTHPNLDFCTTIVHDITLS